MEFRDLKAQYERYKNEIDKAIHKVLNDGVFIGGSEVNRLEQRLAEYVGVKHCISCANGTEAMTLVLMAWGIKAGDAVFVPNFTFFSTAEVVAFLGARPIFVDVEASTFNMDPLKLEEAIKAVKKEGLYTPKVIIPVDLFGLPANHHHIQKIADKYQLTVLEDAAQGFGGSIYGKRAGSFGNAATTSFFPAKPLGCYGDGGAIFTNEDDLASVLKSLKIHGKGVDKYDNVRVGVNSRLDTIQAAILNVKLDAFIDNELNAVQKVAQMYHDSLGDFTKTPIIPEGYSSCYAQYTIQLENREIRDHVQKKLREKDIPSMVYYVKPMHLQSAFKNLQYNQEDLKISTVLCERVLSLPMHPYMKKDEVDIIVETIKKSLEIMNKETKN